MNRLVSATSPYLLQHAQNPVDWYEWGSEAFEAARDRDVPILLSVGYAACHWCHVMAHESFEDPQTAALMNEHFVNVKVDREERPDVDAIYMNATVATTGHGGWPMTCFLDHNGDPFFTGTYFPPEPRHGQLSFTQLLTAITDAWRDRRADIERIGSSVREHLQQSAAPTPGLLDDDAVAAAARLLATGYDPLYAGFGQPPAFAPKFPPSMALEFLRRRGDSSMLGPTLTAMARGGLYDQLGGGFARYSVDREWIVPHFEKMLYDNALLLGLYARWGAAGNELGRRIAVETGEFLLRELRTSEGGFAASLDADTEGVEGKFYVWTPEQLRAELGDEDGRWAAEIFGVTEAGTFEHGQSVLQRRDDPDDLDRFAHLRRRLLAARDRRVRPGVDDKVVAAWNGLAVTALVDAGVLLDRPDFIAAATAAAELIHRVHSVHLPSGAVRLARVSRDGAAGAPEAVLEDLALVAAGYLALAQATAEQRWVQRAANLLDDAMTRFRADDGGFFDTAFDAEQLVARPRDPSDNASPSGVAAVIDALVTYSALTGSGPHREAADQALDSIGGFARQQPRFAGHSLAAAQAMNTGPAEIAIVGPPGPDRDALVRAARSVPGAVVVAAAEGASSIALMQDRPAIDGRPTAYVCRNFVCARGVHTPGELVLAAGG